MSDELAIVALRYAAGELPQADTAAFEVRLATDPAAQDALAEAVRLSARAIGQEPPGPDPLTREAIIDRLRPAASRWGRASALVFQRRPYRGHPITWASAGASVVLGIIFFTGSWLADPTPQTTALDSTPRPIPLVPDMNRTVAVPSPLPAPMGAGAGGGAAEGPPTPATTFLPPNNFPPHWPDDMG